MSITVRIHKNCVTDIPSVTQQKSDFLIIDYFPCSSASVTVVISHTSVGP